MKISEGKFTAIVAIIIAIAICIIVPRCSNEPTSTKTPNYFGRTMESTAKPVRDTFNGAVYDVYKKTTTISWDSLVPIGIVANTPPPVDTVITPPPATNYGTLIYQNDYSKASDINNNQLGEGYFSGIDQVGCFKSYVTGKVKTSGSFRSEQQFDGASFNPNEFVLEYDALYENWKNFGANTGHVVQWHPHGDGLSATLSIYGYQGVFEVVRNISGTNYRDGKYTTTNRNIPSNKFIKHRWEVKWSTGNDGYERLYLDGVLFWSFTGKTKFESENPYFKLGQNRWEVIGGSSAVYYKNLKIWKK